MISEISGKNPAVTLDKDRIRPAASEVERLWSDSSKMAETFGWKPEYGGALELWNKEMTECVVQVPPTFNTAVIFYTDENSPHGYKKITIPEGESRKSFYTYFYTKPEKGVSYRDSKFVSRPDDNAAKKVATGIKEVLKVNGKKLLKALGIKDLDFQDKN